MPSAKLGRGRMLAIALTDDGAVLAFGSSYAFDIAGGATEAEERFADALERAARGRLPNHLNILVETSPSWRRVTRTVKFADIENAAFIINA